MRTLLVDALGPGPLTLTPGESHHLVRVLRAAPGDTVRLTDGTSHEALARVTLADAHAAELVVDSVLAAAPPPPRRVLLGLPKPALVEEALTLGVELGLTELWLCRCRRGHPGEPRVDRLERVLDSALKQCRRADRPRLYAFATLAEALAALPPGPRFLATPGGPGAASYPAPEQATVAVGPEGGWAPDEVDSLQAAGFAPLGLARAILRAPTAVAASLAALSVSGW